MNIKNKILTRYLVVILVITIAGFLGALLKAGSMMFLEADYWDVVNRVNTQDSIPIEATRGNIFSADGKLLASSIPEYELRMDLNSNEYQRKKVKENLTIISKGLNEILPDKPVSFFKKQISTGLSKHSRYKLIYPNRINYIDLQNIKKLPLFKEGQYRSGLTPKQFNYRKKPFQSLAARTVGDMYPDITQGAKNGIELSFNEYLEGKSGSGHKQRIRNKSIIVTDTPPVNGSDVITTLDIDIQDVAEKAIRNTLSQFGGNIGIAIVMEVATGDIKAVVNLSKSRYGYLEQKNHAFADLYEQGSTIKTASILIALDEGKITPQTTYDLGNGTYRLYDRVINDHNYRRGGFEGKDKIKNITEIIGFSSNIGVARAIEDNYKNNKQHFVDRFRELVGLNLDIPIQGAATPVIKNVDNTYVDNNYFSNTTLAWMSFGYETLIPPINIVTFYNSIANNGKMMAPRLVKSIEREGKEIKEFPTKVLNSRIASKKSIKEIQSMLEYVVKEGTAKKYGHSDKVSIAGKTGSAQISKGESGYKGSNKELLVSFCGYFPSEAPKYTCLVSIISSNTTAGGGRESASAAKEIAEKVYGMKINHTNSDIEKIEDSKLQKPLIKRGLLSSTIKVLKELDIEYTNKGDYDKNSITEAKISQDKELIIEKVNTNPKLVPSVYNMGAKDAVYTLESLGLNVTLIGKGKVFRQSIQAGQPIRVGSTIKIELH